MIKTQKNTLCPCGSGKKYKACCLPKDERKKSAKKRRFIFFGVVFCAHLIMAAGGLLVRNTLRPGPYDELAKCLTDRGFVMYGTHWCVNCDKQKEVFGKSFKHINYVECSPGGSREISRLCESKGIRKIPTWVGPDGEKTIGVITINEFRKNTSCGLSAAGGAPVSDKRAD